MKKLRYDDCICRTQLVDHSLIKDRILNEIKLSTHYENINNVSEYYRDKVYRTDMHLYKDLNRSWVQILMPNLYISLNEMLSSMVYNGSEILRLWYHQYLKGDTYGWHIHDKMYAGIYYLEFGKSSGRTQICSPFSLKSTKINAQEGDVVIFPSHLMHRSLPNSDERKTVVSFNFNLKPQNQHYLNLIK